MSNTTNDEAETADRASNMCTYSNDDDNTHGSDSTYDVVQEFADNPMANRVQLALREQLQKALKKSRQELHDQEDALKVVKKAREDCGVQLYGMQQQLDQLQTGVESVNGKYHALVKRRAIGEQSIEKLKVLHTEKKNHMEAVCKDVAQSQLKLDAHLQTLRQAKKYNEKLKSEVSVTRRVAYKAEKGLEGLEKEKETQDLFIENLHEQMRHLETDSALTDEQLKSQRKQSQETNKMLQEVLAELEALAFEKKQLLQQWQSSILALNRRDAALDAASRELKAALEAAKDRTGELTTIYRNIEKSKAEKNILVLSKNRLEGESKFITGEIAKKQQEEQSMSHQFEILYKTIAENREEKYKAERAIRSTHTEISGICVNIDLITRERQALEEKLGTYKYEQTNLSKATISLLREEKALRLKVHDKEIEAADIQNELARLKIDALSTQAHSLQLEETLDAEANRLNEKSNQISKIETEIKRHNGEIEKRMDKIDCLNRKYEHIVGRQKGEEPLGPLEGIIKGLSKDIETEEQEFERLKNDWLSNQTLLVQTIEESDFMQSENRLANAKTNVLKQKRLRLLQGIHSNEVEIQSINANMKGRHTDMTRLNELIATNTQLKTDLSNEVVIKEKEFDLKLKDMEDESMQVEAKIAEVKRAKEQILDEMLEIERQILLWEKKIQLEKETQATLGSSSHAIDTTGMEQEIRRMKHRLEGMKRDQEKMIRLMESAVQKREDNVVKYKKSFLGGEGAIQGKGYVKRPMTISDVKKKTLTFKNQLKQVTQETAMFTVKIEDTKQKLQVARGALEAADLEFEQVQDRNRLLHEEISCNRLEK